jgi:hypothetical protein
MVDKPRATEVEFAPCAVCQKEIPKSVALSPEEQDGVSCLSSCSAHVQIQHAGNGCERSIRSRCCRALGVGSAIGQVTARIVAVPSILCG